jgi:hypothetical protein
MQTSLVEVRLSWISRRQRAGTRSDGAVTT